MEDPPRVLGLVTRKSRAYVSRVEVGGRAYVTDKDGHLGKALGVKEKPLRFAVRGLLQKGPGNLFQSLAVWTY